MRFNLIQIILVAIVSFLIGSGTMVAIVPTTDAETKALLARQVELAEKEALRQQKIDEQMAEAEKVRRKILGIPEPDTSSE